MRLSTKLFEELVNGKWPKNSLAVTSTLLVVTVLELFSPEKDRLNNSLLCYDCYVEFCSKSLKSCWKNTGTKFANYFIPLGRHVYQRNTASESWSAPVQVRVRRICFSIFEYRFNPDEVNEQFTFPMSNGSKMHWQLRRKRKRIMKLGICTWRIMSESKNQIEAMGSCQTELGWELKVSSRSSWRTVLSVKFIYNKIQWKR